ncbi:MAG: 4-(cytidine 5'-diphospho)-2-C-methyl-D-erythritol kinase [Halioglobus sp.]
MSLSLELPAPAKLNLFLHITGRRPDGYHNLQTLFQLLDWGDSIRFTANESGRITLSGPDLGIADEDNLIVRAARTLQTGSCGVDIELNKQIPTGGGLGGGSSDAATTLLALNTIWSCGKSSQELQSIGRTLGADVPVFVAGHTAWAEGTGDQLTPVELPQTWFLILHPGCHVNTQQIFSDPQLTRDTSPITIAAVFRGGSRNDCQPVVTRLYSEVDNALIWLGKFGEAKLTGTGACVFAAFSSRDQAEAVQAQVPSRWTAYVARGVNRSPTHELLL